MEKEHWVVCKVCGTKFDASKKGSYFDGNRYTCPSCFKKITKSGKEGWFKKYWKLIFGPIFILSGLSSIGEYEWDVVLISIFIGAILLIMQFYPKIKTIVGTSTELEVELKTMKEQISVCPNCGAKISGAVCQFCDYRNHELAHQINKLESYVNQPFYKRFFMKSPRDR